MIIQDVLTGHGDTAAAAGDALGIKQAGWRQPAVLRACTGSPLGEQARRSAPESAARVWEPLLGLRTADERDAPHGPPLAAKW